MKQPRSVLGKRLTRVGLVAFGLLFSSVALASIVSGLSTTGSSTNVTITNLPLSKPSDVVAGDLMLASVAIHDGNTVTVTPPTGWTLVLRTDNDSNIGIATYQKTASASEPSSYTWVLNPQTRAQGGITRYSGVDTINPIDVSAGNIGRSKIATTSSITTSSANEQIVTVYALHVGSNNFAGNFFSVPTGMTEKYDSSYTAAGPTIASDDTTQSTAGATGSISSTISGGPNQQRDWAAQTIALRMQAPTTLLNGLVAYWKLDGNSTDATGNGHNGVDTNITYTTSNGILGQGASISSATATGITIPDSAALKPTGSFTVNVWVKTTTATGGGLFQAYSETPNSAGYSVDFGWPSSAFAIGKNTGNTNGTDLGFIWGQANSVIDGNWHMVTAKYDGANMYLYQDGVLVDSAAWSGIAYDLASYIRIGSYNVSGTATNNFWDGSEDELGFWNRVLTTSEISQLYNGGVGRSYPF